jgi:hypothetical protein
MMEPAFCVHVSITRLGIKVSNYESSQILETIDVDHGEKKNG